MISFHHDTGGGYIAMPSALTADEQILQLTMTIKSEEKDGLIFYVADDPVRTDSQLFLVPDTPLFLRFFALIAAFLSLYSFLVLKILLLFDFSSSKQMILFHTSHKTHENSRFITSKHTCHKNDNIFYILIRVSASFENVGEYRLTLVRQHKVRCQVKYLFGF